MYRVELDEAKLAAIVDRLVSAFHPDKIIMFGSRARGDYREDSDLDLMIIGPSELSKFKRTGDAYRAMCDYDVPTDVLWYTPGEAAELAESRYTVVHQALREGKVLYERA